MIIVNFDKKRNDAQIAKSIKPDYSLTYSMFVVVENVYGFRVVLGSYELLTQATRAASALYITTLSTNETLMLDVNEHNAKNV